MDNNRQIKFRAWDGSLMYYDVWIVNGKAYSSDDGYYELFSDREVMFCKSIEQFTGLTDKEGKEIYESDRWGAVLGLNLEGTIVMHEGSWSIKWDNGSCGDLWAHVRTKSGKVIGTIHQ